MRLLDGKFLDVYSEPRQLVDSVRKLMDIWIVTQLFQVSAVEFREGVNVAAVRKVGVDQANARASGLVCLTVVVFDSSIAAAFYLLGKMRFHVNDGDDYGVHS